MPTNFNPALPTDRDRARFVVGDTGTLLDSDGNQVWLLEDATYDAFISQFGYAEGTAQICNGLITRFAQEPDQYEEEGGIMVKWSERIKAWKELRDSLRKNTGKPGNILEASYVGGEVTPPPGMSNFRF